MSSSLQLWPSTAAALRSSVAATGQTGPIHFAPARLGAGARREAAWRGMGMDAADPKGSTTTGHRPIRDPPPPPDIISSYEYDHADVRFSFSSQLLGHFQCSDTSRRRVSIDLT